MIKKEIIQKISNKEMDRKDFLKYGGLVLLSLFGLKTIASILLEPESIHKVTVVEQHKESGRGFGGGKYGV